MDALRKELERKRKAVSNEFGNKKFVSRGEIEKRKLEELRKQEAEAERRKKAAKVSQGNELDVRQKETHSSGPKAGHGGASVTEAQITEQKIDALVLPRAEVIKRLRQFRQPVTLFGETDDERLARLKHLMKTGDMDPDKELLEGQRNDFLRDLTEMKKGGGLALGKKSLGLSQQDKGEGPIPARAAKDGVAGEGAEAGASGDGAEEKQQTRKEDVDHARLEANFADLSAYDQILVFFKRLLKEWEEELDARPEAEQRSTKGRKDLATFKQCARYLEPLFELCRKKALMDDMRDALLTMVRSCLARDYLAATDRYIKLAIGNAPWPIGVTMVGIHERSAREKIHTNSVAHIMNDETTRKYLQSVKRLMTLCQRRYPTAPSRSVEFNSLANGSDLEALLRAEGRGAGAGGQGQPLLLASHSHRGDDEGKGSGSEGEDSEEE